MKQSDFTELTPACCRLGFASIDQCNADEREALRGFLPTTQTVIVVAHHIMHSLEWIWFECAAEPLHETCAADQHARSIAERIGRRLDSEGGAGMLLPYPGPCGVMFKTLAARTALGRLGDSFLFMNAEWGPWIHLRVILTDVTIEIEPGRAREACTHCGRCVEACPSGAIVENAFDGRRCRNKMREMRSALGSVPYVFECERCLRACPIGPEPREVLVAYE